MRYVGKHEGCLKLLAAIRRQRQVEALRSERLSAKPKKELQPCSP